MRIYIESTIPSYVVARLSKDSIQRGRQYVTRSWWDAQRGDHDLFVSQLVLDEVGKGEDAMASKRLEVLEGILLLDPTVLTSEMARKLVDDGLLPKAADSDAVHIALATAYEMDVLLTWNCRHIANPFNMGRLRRWFAARGFELPTVCTPVEFAGDLRGGE